MTPRKLDNRRYYDIFSERYDSRRMQGYHWMIDTLQSEVLLPLARDKDVLELGCGTGLLMDRLDGRCRSLVGMDLSSGMLRKAAQRGHRVVQASVEHLPFSDEQFDLVYSFKVLAHVRPIREALKEAARVLRPGGYLVADFYNPLSLRGLAKRFLPAGRVGTGTKEADVYTRFDDPKQIVSLLPEDLEPVTFKGVRVLTPWARLLDIPGATPLATRVERIAGSLPLLWRLGGFLVTVTRKRGR